MTIWIAVASMVLAAVGAAGVLRPFTRPRAVVMERLTDPMEDERRSLLRALRELDAERDAGQLSAEDHAALRSETEARAVSVLRAIEARDGAGELAAGMKDLQPAAAAHGNGLVRARRVRSAVPVLAVAAVLVAGMVPLLVHAVSSRSSGQSITGDTQLAPSGGNAVDAARQRVAQHPSDAAARLDLAQAYLGAGDEQDAATQYLTVIRLDPTNVEAHAALGMIVYRSGKASDGLGLVKQALAVDPNDPESLYDEGVILLRGLHQPQEAGTAFRAYLAAAPFGAHRQEVEQLLQGITTP